MMDTLKLIGSLLIAVGLILSGPTTAHENHCEDTQLGAYMADMKKARKQLKRAIRNEDFAEIIEHAQSIQKLAKQSSELKPLKYKHSPEAFESRKTDYAKSYGQLGNALDGLIASARSQSAENLDEWLSRINRIRKQAHKSFRLECD